MKILMKNFWWGEDFNGKYRSRKNFIWKENWMLNGRYFLSLSRLWTIETSTLSSAFTWKDMFYRMNRWALLWLFWLFPQFSKSHYSKRGVPALSKILLTNLIIAFNFTLVQLWYANHLLSEFSTSPRYSLIIP